MASLYQNSLSIIKKGQSSTGAYVASPNFSNYQYCWLRDGSFIAHSMDVAGEYASAAAFFRWVGRAINSSEKKVEIIQQKLLAGQPIKDDDALYCRFTLDGKEENKESTWGKFQIDGYGTWLWALTKHVRLSGDTSLLQELVRPIETTLRYIQLVWKLPNYDCWEEFPEYLHPYSLSSIYGGLKALASLINVGLFQTDVVEVSQLANQIFDFLQTFAVEDGLFVKHVLPAQNGQMPRPLSSKGVDASLIGLAIPYETFPADHPLVVKTIQAIETGIRYPEGGVYRYKEDVYYGGGEWVLLTAWLGWYYALTGSGSKAENILHWIEAQADENGYLAEQYNDHCLAPKQYVPWVSKWGPVAKPLLWSHAMYIILANALQQGR